MKAVDLFAGLGGFTEGATQAGAEVVWASSASAISSGARASCTAEKRRK